MCIAYNCTHDTSMPPSVLQGLRGQTLEAPNPEELKVCLNRHVCTCIISISGNAAVVVSIPSSRSEASRSVGFDTFALMLPRHVHGKDTLQTYCVHLLNGQCLQLAPASNLQPRHMRLQKMVC